MAAPNSPCSPTRSSAWSGATAPERTICCGWPGAAGCSRGPARASTTSSRSDSRSSAICPPAKRPARPASGPSTRSPRKGCEALRAVRADPRRLHAAQERAATAPAALRPRRRGRHPREHGHATRRHRRHSAALGRHRTQREAATSSREVPAARERLPAPAARAAPRPHRSRSSRSSKARLLRRTGGSNARRA